MNRLISLFLIASIIYPVTSFCADSMHSELGEQFNQDHLNLFSAIVKNDIGTTNLLLTKGTSCNIRWPKTEDTPLIAAAKMSHVAIADLLIFHKADVNAKNEYGQTALIHAADKGFELFVDTLLKAKANVNHQDTTGSTALLHAADKGHASVVKTLLRQNADPNISQSKITPLMSSVVHPSKEIVTLLIAGKADPSKSIPHLGTALCQAIFKRAKASSELSKEYDTIIKILYLYGMPQPIIRPSQAELTVMVESDETMMYKTIFTEEEAQKIRDAVERAEKEVKQAAEILPQLPSYEEATAGDECKAAAPGGPTFPERA